MSMFVLPTARAHDEDALPGECFMIVNSGLVSVVTACFNSVQHIERCIRSVAHQSCRPLEHIVVDDGSTDGTADLLAELSAEFAHLKFLRQANSGAGPARNAAIGRARGRYIAFIDSDDAWSGDKLASQVRFMEETEAPFTYGDYAVADGMNGESLGRFVAPETLTYRELLVRCPIACSTVAYNQERLGKRYMPAIRRGQDWALWLELTRNGVEARKYPGCHVTYHLLKGSLSKRKIGKAYDMYRIYRHEESKNILHSLYLLFRHTMNVIRKKPEKHSLS